jgi:hypothetical protein
MIRFSHSRFMYVLSAHGWSRVQLRGRAIAKRSATPPRSRRTPLNPPER